MRQVTIKIFSFLGKAILKVLYHGLTLRRRKEMNNFARGSPIEVKNKRVVYDVGFFWVLKNSYYISG